MTSSGTGKNKHKRASDDPPAHDESADDSRPLVPSRIRERMRNLQWGAVIALLVSVSALLTSTYNNYLIYADRKVKESPFVIPGIEMRDGRYTLSLENFSSLSARVKAIRLASGGRVLTIGDSNRRRIIASTSPEFRNILAFSLFEQFGIDTSGSIGVNVDINIPIYIGFRQKLVLVEVSELESVVPRLPDELDYITYVDRLYAGLEFEVCSCDIYDEICMIAGTAALPTRVDTCPITSSLTAGTKENG